MQTVKLGSKWNFSCNSKPQQVDQRAQFGGGWISPPNVKEHVRQTQERVASRQTGITDIKVAS